MGWFLIHGLSFLVFGLLIMDSGFGFPVSIPGLLFPLFMESGFWVLDSEFWFLVSGFWLLVSGFWHLVSVS